MRRPPADIANCFSAIPRDKLMQAVEERVMPREPREELCARCCRHPAVFLVRPHRLGYCCPCWVALINTSAGHVPELSGAA